MLYRLAIAVTVPQRQQNGGEGQDPATPKARLCHDNCRADVLLICADRYLLGKLADFDDTIGKVPSTRMHVVIQPRAKRLESQVVEFLQRSLTAPSSDVKPPLSDVLPKVFPRISIILEIT